MKCLLGFLLCLAMLPGVALPSESDDKHRVRKILDKEGLTYKPVTKAAIEGISAVRPLSGAAAFVLLRSPDTAVAALRGGMPGVASSVAKGMLIETLRVIAKGPDQVTLHLASADYREGLASYRTNYRLARRIEKGGDFSLAEARQFLVDHQRARLLGAAAAAIRSVRSKQYASSGDARVLEQLAEEVAKLADLSEGLAYVELLARAAGIAATSQRGLEAFEPYLVYSRRSASIRAEMQRELEGQPRRNSNQPQCVAIDVDGTPHAVGVDGSSPRLVTHACPHFVVPDGSRGYINSRGRILSIARPGADPEPLPLEGTNVLCDVSPDGSRLAFMKLVGDGMQIGTMLPNGTDIRFVPEAGTDTRDPQFGRDSQTLYFVRHKRGRNKSASLCRIGLDGRGLAVVRDASDFATAFRMSPDRRQIAFGRSTERALSWHIWIYELAGGSMRKLAEVPLGNLRWSRDSKYIVGTVSAGRRSIAARIEIDSKGILGYKDVKKGKAENARFLPLAWAD